MILYIHYTYQSKHYKVVKIVKITQSFFLLLSFFELTIGVLESGKSNTNFGVDREVACW